MRVFEALVPENVVQEHRTFIRERNAGNVIEGTRYSVRSTEGETPEN